MTFFEIALNSILYSVQTACKNFRFTIEKFLTSIIVTLIKIPVRIQISEVAVNEDLLYNCVVTITIYVSGNLKPNIEHKVNTILSKHVVVFVDVVVPSSFI